MKTLRVSYTDSLVSGTFELGCLPSWDPFGLLLGHVLTQIGPTEMSHGENKLRHSDGLLDIPHTAES